MQKINRQTRMNFNAGSDGGFEPQHSINTVYLVEPAPLYATYPDGEIVLIGYGHEFKFQLDEIQDVIVWSTAQGSALVPDVQVYRSEGEVFTNFDKRPVKSALEQSVTLALRRLKAEQQALAQERAKLREKPQAERAPERVPERTPEPEPEPTPEPGAVTE